MATNTVKTRIQLKNDTEANWLKAEGFIPLKGEVIIYNIDDTHPFFRLKVGDGVTNVISLPFLDSGTINGITAMANGKDYWDAHPDYVAPENALIIIPDKAIMEHDGFSYNVPGIKIGDGITPINELTYIGDDIITLLMNHINDDSRHITNADRERWNNKVLDHKLTFGSSQNYVFDGSEDVTVPVYGGIIT